MSDTLTQLVGLFRADGHGETSAVFAAYRLRDRIRAEALLKAADAVEGLPQDDECDPGRGDAVDLLRRMADEGTEKGTPEGESTPAFFQPGRTYAYQAGGFTAPELLTVFRVASAASHPATGEPVAFGWIRKGETTAWVPYAEPATEWPDAWTEITENGDAR